jgi:hypothetical protein
VRSRINIVIASAAKQSRVFPRMHFWIALLCSQCGVASSFHSRASSLQAHFRILAAHFARALLGRLTLT